MRACLSLSSMPAAGSSRTIPVPGARDPTSYEEDLTRMVSQLDFLDIENLWQTAHRSRIRRGHGISDQEMANIVLLIQNSRELANIEADRVAAQPDPAPR